MAVALDLYKYGGGQRQVVIKKEEGKDEVTISPHFHESDPNAKKTVTIKWSGRL
jgi:hypothetical protein